MQLIKIGIANVNATVGNFTGNFSKVAAIAEEALREKVTLVAFNEQVISGYPVQDLVQFGGFVERQLVYLETFATISSTYVFPTVFVLGVTVAHGRNLYNCAAVVQGGTILGMVPKEQLPEYGVFYDGRTFSSGVPYWLDEVKLPSGTIVPIGDMIFDLPFGKLAVEVCEDIWTPGGPMARRVNSGAEIIVNISASPFRAGVVETRKEMLSTRSSDNPCILIYSNLYGGQDALAFDGGGYVIDNGRIVHEAPRWHEGLSTAIVDLDVARSKGRVNTTARNDNRRFREKEQPVAMVSHSYNLPATEYPYPIIEQKNLFLPDASTMRNPEYAYLEDLIEAIKTCIAGYFEKAGKFEHIVIALSGGKDSALCLYLAWLYALDRFAHLPDDEKWLKIHDFIRCYSMPTQYNSDETKDIARRLCDDLGVSFTEQSIQELYDTTLRQVIQMNGAPVSRITDQNIQARIRGSLIMDIANAVNGLVLQTSNMTEKSVGYATYGGDMLGGFSPLGNVPKTIVIELLRFLNGYGEGKDRTTLGLLLASKASAELEEDQEDERDLPPFLVIETVFLLHAGEKYSAKDIYFAVRHKYSDEDLYKMSELYVPGMLKEWVKRILKMFYSNIFKWVQSPPAAHVGSLELDTERALQLPMAKSLEWLKLEEIDDLPD